MFKYHIFRAGFGKFNRTFSKKRDVRVRFAPSPTGYLHLGGLRTAFYNYLFAKSSQGKFILRIEDTDQSRVIDGAREELQKDINWSGIHVDEGPNIGGDYGPYIQSKRIDIYKEQLQVLLKNGSAYKCFCTNKRLNLLRTEALRLSQIPKYDNRCRFLSEEDIKIRLDRGDTYCIRFKLTDGVEQFNDLIYGLISYNVVLNEGDPVIMKSDGYPTYHFANVVDDHFMNISHVLRGVEWQISTTKHLMMYRAFQWEPPQYGHLPLLLNPDGSKLSKRQGDIRISSYRNSGIMPQALLNFIASSGGGYEKDTERFLKPKSFTMSELIQQFDLKNINSHSGKIMPERLYEFNQLEIERQMESNENIKHLITTVQGLVRSKFPDRSSDSLQLDEEYIKAVLKWAVKRINCLNDLVSHQLLFLWIPPKSNQNLNQQQLEAVKQLINILLDEKELSKENLKEIFHKIAESYSIKFKNLMQLLRSILSGLEEGPSVAEMIIILGKEHSLLRLKSFINKR